MRLFLSLVVVAVLSGLVVGNAEASISFTGTPYSQNFDTLANTQPSAPTTLAWTNNSTIAGWYLFNKDLAAPPTYRASNGGDTTGSFVSFGATGVSERALGGLGSGGTYFGSPGTGAIAGWIAFAATNGTGSVLDSFTVGFDGEQWRNGGNTTAQTMVLEYGFGNTFSTVSTWTAPGSTFDWASPVATATAATVVGNVAGLVSGRGGTISNLTWATGDTLWIRWVERNDSGNDHGLAIDDFEFTATAVPNNVIPEPASLLVWGGAGLLGIGLAIYKKRIA